MQSASTKTRVAIFVLVAAADALLARFAALTISNVPGVVTFFFAVAFMIAFALWFGAWGAAAAYVGCFIGSGIPAGLPWQVNLYWSLADLWQVLIPLVAFKILKADVALRSKRDAGVFLLFGVLLNNLAGAVWGATMFVVSGHFSVADFQSLFGNWFLGNMIVALLITPLLLRFVTPAIKKIWGNLKKLVKIGWRLNDSGSLERFSLPRVLPDSRGFAVTARCAPFFAHVVSASSASSAIDVYCFALAFAE